MFLRFFTHNAHAKKLTFHQILLKQRPKSDQNIPNHCNPIENNSHGMKFY